MPQSTRSGLAVAQIALVCLVLPACSGEPQEESSPAPDRKEIAAAIEGYADVIYEFDQLRAIVAATDDRIVFEQYYGTDPDAYRGVQSVTKSVVSTLVGIALDEGLIGGVDDRLAQLLPDYADVMSPAVAGTTLRQLLTMTAGFPSGGTSASGPAFTSSKDWVHEILTNPMSPPGERFVYSDGTSHLLAAVLEEATGSTFGFARSRLFEPLGIDTRPAMRRVAMRGSLAENLAAYERADFAWPRDPQGISTGWWGLKLRPRDMLALGQLFLAGGRWDGRQVVSAEWVDEATKQQVAAGGLGEGYGYQWWTDTVDGEAALMALGYGGQVIEVIPDRNLVVVTSTEVHAGDPTSNGIEIGVLRTVIEDAVVSEFAAD